VLLYGMLYGIYSDGAGVLIDLEAVSVVAPISWPICSSAF